MAKTDEILVVTTNDVPGYEVVEVYGEVFGLIVRSRNIFSNIGSSFRTILGGESGGLTKLLVDSRGKAMDRLREEAASKGANAILAFPLEILFDDSVFKRMEADDGDSSSGV